MNWLIVGPRQRLASSNIKARDVNWIAGYPAEQKIQAQVKIRYKAPLESATIVVQSDENVEIVFDDPVYAATPGQGVVFYQGDVCLGGGIIDDGEEG